MKRVFSIILSVILILSVLPLSAFAVDYYNLWVGNVRVTSENASAITGEGISGSISYDDATHTLTLENATISGAYQNYSTTYGIKAESELTVNAVGENTIISASPSNYYGIEADGLGIEGTGSLEIKGNETNSVYFGILSYKGLTLDVNSLTVSGEFAALFAYDFLTVNGGTVNASATEIAIRCYWNSYSKVTVNAGSVYAKGGNYGISTSAGLEIGEGVTEVIAYGANKYGVSPYDADKITVADGIDVYYNYTDGKTHNQVFDGDYSWRLLQFVRPDPDAINIWFGGVQLNSSNIGDITAMLNEKYPGSASGTAYLTRANDTSPAVLTLDDFSYNGFGGTTIQNSYTYTALEICEDLVISVSGNSTIKYADVESGGSDNCAVLSKSDCALTIVGDGTLNCIGGNAFGGSGDDRLTSGMSLSGPLTVSGNVTLTATGGSNCQTSIGCSLYSDLTLEGNATLLFTGCEVNGYYCSSKGMACNTTKTVTFNFADSWCGSFTAVGQTSSFDNYGTLVLEGQDIDVVGYYNGGGDRDIIPSRRGFGEFSYYLKLVITPFVEKQPIYVSGIRVTEANYDDVLGDGGTVSYDKASNTLILNNANIESDGDRDCMQDINGIQLATDNDYNSYLTLNIKAIGTNTVKGASVDNSYPTCGFYTYSRYSTVNIELTDGATLNLMGGSSDTCQHGSYGISMNGSNLNVTGKGTLNASGGSTDFYGCSSVGMYLGSNTVFDGDVVINASSGSVADSATSVGIMCDGGNTVELKGNVIINCNACPDAKNSIGFNINNYNKTLYLKVKDWKGTMTCAGTRFGFTSAYGYATSQSTGSYLNLDDYLKVDMFLNADDASAMHSEYISDESNINDNPLIDDYSIGDVQKVVFNPYRTFPDVPEGSWFYDYVKTCAIAGIIKGYVNGNFGPNDNLQRQDFVVILARLFDVNLEEYAGKSSGLKDVKAGQYYTAAINWSVENGIIIGYTAGSKAGNFGIGDPITREQIATIIYRIMLKEGFDGDVSEFYGELEAFGDCSRISPYAKDAMAYAVHNGIITGMNPTTLNPTGMATRAQIAAIIVRTFSRA